MGTTVRSYAKKKKMNQALTYSLHKVNSKMIKALTVKHKTIQLLEDDIRQNLDDVGFDVSYNTKDIIYKRNN